MKKILCYYYLIGSYTKNYKIFDDWYHNFKQYFCPLSKRDFLLVTDNDELIEKYKDYPDIIIRKCEKVTDINIAKSYKFKYLKDNIDLLDNYDYIHYSNSNLRCNKIVRYPDLLKRNEFGITTHPYFNNTNFNYLNSGINKNTSIEINEDTSKFIYFQCSNFIGIPNFIKNLINFVEEKREIDFKNNIIQKWHDETYVNYYLNVILKRKNITALNGLLYTQPKYASNYKNKKILFKLYNNNFINYNSCIMFTLDKNNFYKI